MTLTDHQRHSIVTKREEGKSYRTIAHEMNVNVKTVIRWIRRFDETNTVALEEKEQSPKKSKIK